MAVCKMPIGGHNGAVHTDVIIGGDDPEGLADMLRETVIDIGGNA
jgi:hypothetical protein